VVLLTGYLAIGFGGGYAAIRFHHLGLLPPVLSFVLLLIMLIALTLSSAAFWFDRWRIPVLTIVVVFSMLSWAVSHVDHYFVTANGNYDPSVAPSAATRHASDVEPLPAPVSPSDETVIVISAPGGGIQAEAWSARVLVGLHRRLGKNFDQSLKLISGVSGGAVGAMFYVEGLYCAYQSGTVLHTDQILHASRASGLGAVGWGVVHPDLMRLIFPIFPLARETDRGWALEEAWASELDHFECGEQKAPPTTLQDWKTRVNEDALPATIFNATLVNTGGPLLIGTVSPKELEGGDKVDVFASPKSLFQGANLKVVTAARLAASFPYVTPVSRIGESFNPRCEAGAPCASHVADGGYFDNFGASSAVRWILHLFANKAFQRNVIFVEILPFPDTPPIGDPLSANGRGIESGWSAEILGPPTAIFHARESTQSQGADLELSMLEKIGRSYSRRFERVKFAFDPGDDTQAPLSWQLSPDEKSRIDQAWCKGAALAGC
jgi:hypothetical protein